eukprot:scaffold9237_cov72-Skeletonema_dohrnii-CCMP3373.AAC.2
MHFAFIFYCPASTDYSRDTISYRPVYASLDGNEALSGDTVLILFTGERWIISYEYLFPDLKYVTDKKDLVNFFSKFHGYFTQYSVVYESEPVSISKQADADVKASPLSIRWRSSSSYTGLASIQMKSEFFCAECKICWFGGICRSNGTCDCPDGYSGTWCEIAPKISDGYCDQQYNNEQLGGDCCDNTCRSTPENTCGKVGLGYIDTGYPSCIGYSYNRWELSADPLNGVSSASRSGQAVALSGNGKVLAVADPGLSIVRLFDKDGAEWKQRGQHIQGKPSSNFGAVIGLSDESFNVVSNPRTFPTVTLVVGAPKIGIVRVFTCSTDGCIQRGEDIIGSGRFGTSLSIDGDNIVIGDASKETISQGTAINGEVKVFTWSNNTWRERGSVPIATPSSTTLTESSHQFRLQGYYVSLSGDYLAVGSLEGKVLPGPRFQSAKLIIQVFKWNSSTGWAQLGDGIERKFYEFASFGTPWPLKCVVIKGSIVAVGSNSTVDVYSWSDVSNEWIPREEELAKGHEGSVLSVVSVGWSLDLSEDASILAVGESESYVENPLRTDEYIQMYKWNGTHYNALIYESIHGSIPIGRLPAGPAASLSLSSDGKAVAVGLPFDSSNGGSTEVYNFYPIFPCDDTSKIPVRISFTTDGSPQETSWELQVDSEVKLSSGSLAGHMYTTFVEEMCVPAEACVRLNVYDTKGDGHGKLCSHFLALADARTSTGSHFLANKGTNYTTSFLAEENYSYSTPGRKSVKQCEGESNLVTIEITLVEKPWSSYCED